MPNYDKASNISARPIKPPASLVSYLPPPNPQISETSWHYEVGSFTEGLI